MRINYNMRKPRSSKRRFSRAEKIALLLWAGGKCEGCGVELKEGWHGDHVRPWAKGGITDVLNGQALCPACNLKKGTKLMNFRFVPRAWQAECSEVAFKAFEDGQLAFTAAVGVGSGKTLWGVSMTHQLIDASQVDSVIVVCPSEPIQASWCFDFSKFGLAVRKLEGNSDLSLRMPADESGYVTTYQSVAMQPLLHRRRCAGRNVLVILDELHHLGDAKTDEDDATAWADGCLAAFDGAAKHVLCLTGTPGRGDARRLPFVSYDSSQADGVWVPKLSAPLGYTYTYGNAVNDRVVRRTGFRFVSAEGQVQVKNKDGGMVIAEGGSSTSEEKSMLRNHLEREALNIEAKIDNESVGVGAQAILTRTLHELDCVKARQPDAAALIVCFRVAQAKLYQRILEFMGRRSVVVYDDKNSNPARIIEAFKTRRDVDVIIAVNMVSEGVNIPRLRVCGFLSPIEADLTLTQILGRIVRTNWQSENVPFGEVRDPDDNDPMPGEAVFVCLDKPELRKFATAVEKEMDAAAKEPRKREKGEKEPPPPRIEYESAVNSMLTSETGGIVGGLHFETEVIPPYDRLRQVNPDTRASLEDVVVLFREMQKATPARTPETEALSVMQQKELLSAAIDRRVRVLGKRMVDQGSYKKLHYLANEAAGIKSQKEATLMQLKKKLEWLEGQKEAAA